jgi:hypothetical protein
MLIDVELDQAEAFVASAAAGGNVGEHDVDLLPAARHAP